MGMELKSLWFNNWSLGTRPWRDPAFHLGSLVVISSFRRGIAIPWNILEGYPRSSKLSLMASTVLSHSLRFQRQLDMIVSYRPQVVAVSFPLCRLGVSSRVVDLMFLRTILFGLRAWSHVLHSSGEIFSFNAGFRPEIYSLDLEFLTFPLATSVVVDMRLLITYSSTILSPERSGNLHWHTWCPQDIRFLGVAFATFFVDLLVILQVDMRFSHILAGCMKRNKGG